MDDRVKMIDIISSFNIRMIGPNFDISLRLSTEEDFEIVERLLAKAKASICAQSGEATNDPR